LINRIISQELILHQVIVFLKVLQQLIKKAKKTNGDIDPQEVLRLISLISSRHSGKGDKNIEKIQGGYKVYYYKNVNGQKVRTCKRFPGKTLKQAKEIRDTLAFESDQVSNTVLTTRMTLNEYMELYFNKYAPLTFGADTIFRNRLAYDKHFRSVLGDELLQRITSEQIEDLKANLIKDHGLKPSSVNLYMSILFNAFERAVKYKKMTVNPMKDVARVKRVKTKRDIWDIATYNQFINEIDAHHYKDLIELTVRAGGLRRGEILGLQWKNIDFKRKEIRIENQLKDKVGLSPLKTESSRRTNEIDDGCIQILERIKSKQIFDQKRLEWGVSRDIKAGKGDCFVFADHNGNPLKPKNVSFNFMYLVKSKGYSEISFHDLRHFFVSLAISSSQPLYVISRMLGHSSIEMTMDTYGHLLPNNTRGVMKAVTDKLAQNS